MRKIKGHLRLVAHSDGRARAVREAHNLVVRGGGELVARRLFGSDVPPVNRVALGFARDSADPDATALTPPEAVIAPEALSADLAPEALTFSTDQDGFVRVSIAAEFTPVADLENVTEAGLFSDDTLYNQVVFEPVTLRTGQRVTFFWDIDIPFGD